ncbi:centrosomal protein of 126 kDa-like [Liolophura sinensis]|uniref:centrosomal protein of 126 kDa-like n=1 Tax=Liolophura sinensis TaxID=3198878 RepID=UPI003158F166
MFTGAYSNRYQILENQHLEHLKQMNSSNRGDVIAKTKLLSHETNRRRRALAIKRKIDAQREEKRRQEILLKRREKQREATEKFQRYRKNSKGEGPCSQRSPSPTRGVTSALIPGLDDALKAVRGRKSTSPVMIACQVDNNTKYSTRKESPEVLQKAFYTKYGSSSTPPAKDRVQEQAKETAARADLHNRSLRNLTNSKSLFEQQLEQHQQLVLEQQKNSLREFNAALRKEIEEDLRGEGVSGIVMETDAVREENEDIAESLSSLDSLEAHCPDKENSFTDTEPVGSDNLVPAVETVQPNWGMVSGPGEDETRKQCKTSVAGHRNGMMAHSKVYPSPPTHVDSSRSDITADTVSTIDIRNGNVQQPGPPPKQFFLPRYNVFTDVGSMPAANSRTVTDWVSQQNSLLNCNSVNKDNRGNIAVEEAPDTGTLYMKAWAPTNSITTKMPGAPKLQDGAQPNTNDAATLVHTTPSRPIPQTRTTRPRPQSAKPTSGTNRGLGSKHGESDPSGQSHVTDMSPSDVLLSPPSPETAQTHPTHSPKHARPVRAQPPTISNGGLGFSNGLLTLCADTNDSEQGSDSGSLCRDPSIISPGSRKQNMLKVQKVKSILKKAEETFSKHSAPFKRSNSFGGKPSIGLDVKDSLEVIRQHNGKVQTKEKKKVRFAEVEYQEENSNSDIEAKQKPVNTTQKSTPVTHKPPRPTSARVISSPKASPVPTRRAVSAGPVRPSPQAKSKPVDRPQAAAHIITHQSSFSNPVTTANGHQISLVSTSGRPPAFSTGRGQTTTTRTTTATTPTTNGRLFESLVQTGAVYPPQVYDDSGLRLDRTPTDDEINWLWDKVRTCLHRDSQVSSRGSETSDGSNRQAVIMSSKLFDGAMLGQHANVTRVASSNLRRYNSAESVNSYSKRNALLQQRQQQLPHSISSHRSGSRATPSQGSLQNPKPSLHDPQSASSNTNNHHQDMSESMAGFLAAEALAEQSVSDSTMHTALEAAQQRQQMINANKPNPRVPTALSIEEQRLMESIDKLNEKLKNIVIVQRVSRHVYMLCIGLILCF